MRSKTTSRNLLMRTHNGISAINIDINDIPDQLLIDTSVWIFTVGPQADPNDHISAVYSDLLAKVIKRNSQIIVTPQILSEFFNVTVGYFKRKHDKSMSNKDYRRSADYKKNLPAILAYLNSLISTPNISFIAENDVAPLLSFVNDDLDFNDNSYVQLCLKTGCAIVTHDGDFKYCGCLTISANPVLC